MTLELPEEWHKVASRFGERWVHEETYRDDSQLSRAHLVYYPEEETVEVAVDGKYTFKYHNTTAGAHDTAKELAAEATKKLADRDDVAFWEPFTHTEGDR